MAPRAAIIFDLDGTLVDSAPDLHECANVLMDEMGLPSLELKTVTGFIGHGIAPLVQAVLKHNKAALSPNDSAQAITRFTEIYAANPAQFCQPYAGVIDALAALKASGREMAICTNKSCRLARRVVDAVGLDIYCPVLIGGDSLAVRKPDPAPLYECARLLGNKNYLYVGDSEIDAHTAQKAGVLFFLHTQGYRKTAISDLYHTDTFDHWHNFIPALTARNL